MSHLSLELFMIIILLGNIIFFFFQIFTNVVKINEIADILTLNDSIQFIKISRQAHAVFILLCLLAASP